MDEHTKGQIDKRDFVGPSGGPIIKVTLRFPEFISKHPKSVYSINFFARYSQF